MEQIAKVQSVEPNGIAHVIRLQEGACHGNCSLCGGCESQEPMKVLNDIGAKPGDKVLLRPDTKVARKTATMLYTIPPVLLLVGYLLGEHYLSRGGLFGVLGAVIGLWLVLFADRKMSQKHSITYHITGYAEEETA